jgi:hypothetical protein
MRTSLTNDLPVGEIIASYHATPIPSHLSNFGTGYYMALATERLSFGENLKVCRFPNRAHTWFK